MTMAPYGRRLKHWLGFTRHAPSSSASKDGKHSYDLLDAKKAASASQKAQKVYPTLSIEELKSIIYNPKNVQEDVPCSLPQIPPLDVISTTEFVNTFVYHPPLGVEAEASTINMLPDDVWLMIMNYLPSHTVQALSRVCRLFRTLIISLQFAKTELHIIQPHPYTSGKPSQEDNLAIFSQDFEKANHYSSKHIGPLVKSLSIYITYIGDDTNDRDTPQQGLTETVLRRFASYRNLHSLDLSFLYITPFHVQQISNLPLLSQLSLENCKCDDSVFTIPCSLEKLSVVYAYNLPSPLVLKPFCSPSSLRRLVYQSDFAEGLFDWFIESGPWLMLRDITAHEKVANQDGFLGFVKTCHTSCQVLTS